MLCDAYALTHIQDNNKINLTFISLVCTNIPIEIVSGARGTTSKSVFKMKGLLN